MVAIVSGNGLGVSLSSLSTLGASAATGGATQGHNGELAFVNIANGNLILQDHDASQSALGAITLDSLRVYNSEGTLDATDNWTNGFQMQRVALASGTLNGATSTLTRTDTDGAVATYTFANGVYTTTAGGGAYDTITWNATTQTFSRVDTATGATEKYDSSGRLVSLSDAKGNAFTYTYNGANLVTSVKDSAGVVRTYYDYDTSNRLTQIRTVSASGVVTSLVHYTFDGANRLATVSVDLTPADSSILDGKVYTTTYTYVGATKQLQSVTQGDGSSLTFAYVPSDPTFRLQSVTDNLGNKTSFAYDAVNRKTTVTDANNQSTVYSYDASGQLLSVAVPSAAGTATTSYTYNANGDLTQVADPSARTILMTYDANGNQLSQMDAAGNTVTRTFDANKQLATETAWVVPDPDGIGAGQPATPMTTRYVYDAASGHQLRFVLTPEGRVTQYVYNATNQRVATITYPGAAYAVGSLGATAVPTEAQMATWVGTQDLTTSVRTDIAYDIVGNIAQTLTYAKVDSTGAGVADGTQSLSKYVYDQYGHLLQVVKPGTGTTTFTYDGLGRVLTQQDAHGTATTVYDDANNRVVATAVNGLITTSTYDKANRLVSVVQGTSATPTLGTTTYAYDADGNRLMATDPDGNRTFALYDAARRQVATVDAAGLLTETVYNLAGQVVETIRYATAVNLSLLVDGTGKALNPALSAIRPAGTTFVAWTLYDTAGRVAKRIDAAGYVTEMRYDGDSRVTDVIGWANAVAIAGITAATLPTAAAATPTADAVNDRRTRTFYDNDGNVVGKLDAEGYLSENVYDAAGRVVHTIRYAVATAAANRATGTLATLRPAADNLNDIHGWNYYDDESQLIGSVDGEGYLTEYTYDLDGHVVKVVRHAAPALVAPTAITASTTLASLRPTATTGDQVTQSVYDGLGQLTSTTNPEGTVTQYTYDVAGNVLTTTVAAATVDVRTDTRKYDAQGHLVAELGGVGSAALAALGATPTAQQVADVWSAYGTSYTYDAAGLRTSATDPAGNKTLYYYDVDGRATHTVNALGEVEETAYNVLGQVVAITRIGTRIATTGLVGGIDTAALLSAIASAKNATLDSKTTYTYLAQGTVGSKTDELGDLTTYTYNAFGQATLATQSVGGNGASALHQVDYDRRGLVKDTQESSADEVTSYVYDAFGRAVTATDPNGNITSTTFDRLGRTTKVTGPMFVSSQTSYDAFGRALTVKDANGNAMTYVYDDVARTMTMTDVYGVVVTRTHDREGETISILDGDGNTTSYAYDLDGRLKDTIVDAGAGHLALDTHTDYDGAGRVADTIDANGNKVTYQYDAANRVFKRTEGVNTSMNLLTTYGYDAKGQLSTQQGPDSVVTSITYDLGGHVLTRTVDTAGLQLKTTNTYDLRGNLLTSTDPSGVVTTYGYNTIGRRISQQIDTTLKLTTQYGYDGDGNVTRVIDPDGNVTLNAYDKAGRLIYTQDAAGNVTGQTYDNDGHVLTVTRYAKAQTALVASVTANGTVGIAVSVPTATAGQDQVTTYTYDTNGRKTLAEVDRAGLDLKTQYFYDGAGNLTKVVDPNGAATLYIYDAANRATSVLSPAGTLTQTVYDADGHVTQTTVYAGAKAMTTTVGTSGQVTNAISGTITASVNDIVTTYTYDAANRRRTATVDPAGLALKTQYAYDAAGNLTQVTDPAGNITYFGYDAAGRQRYVLDPQNILTETVYDGAGRVTATIVYGTAPTGLSAVPNAAGLVTPTFSVVGSATLDRVTRYGYDAAGRQVYAVDALGYVTETAYDAAGLVTGVCRYAKAITLPAAGAADGRTLAMSTAAIKAAITSSGADRTTRYAYDSAGRKIFSVDATGAVTGYTYDAFNQLAVQHAYATKVAQPAWGTAFTAAAITTALGAANPADRLTRFGYDNAGRTIYSVDALGVVTASVYDADSRLIKSQVYHAAITLPTDGSALTGAAIAAKLAATAGTDVVTRYAYDADGHQVYAVDALGFATGCTYDSQGRLRAKTVYASPVTLPSTPGAPMSAADITAALHPSASTDQVTRYVVDDAGRVTWIIDPLGHVTGQSFDKDGNVTSRKEYAVATNITALALVIGPSDFSLTVTAAADRLTRYFYDGDNRLRFEVDALNYVTETSYQADRTVTTRYAAPIAAPAAGAVTADVATAVAAVANATNDHKTTVVFDKDGQSTDTTTPDGFVARDVYDAFGRVTTHTDALGRPEQLVTSYVYDAVGRVTSRTVGQGTLAQTTLTTYDALGNVDTIVSPDGYALAYLDSTWAQAERPRFGSPAASASLTAAQRTELLARYTTKFTYDLNGRRLTTTTSYQSTTSPSTSTSTKYDAFGNAVKVVDPLGNIGYFYFDKLGRVTLQVDPLLNVVGTSYTGGFADKVAAVRRYVNKAPAGTNETVAPSPGTTALDAVTTYTYDRLGRILTTVNAAGTADVTTESVKWSTSDGNIFNKVVTNKLGGATTYVYDVDGRELSETLPVLVGTTAVKNTYQYDAFGNRTQSVEAVGLPEARTTTFRYDAMGRVVYRIGTAYTAFDAAAQTSSTVTPVDWTIYDALGRITETRTNASWNASTGTASGGTRTLDYFDAVGNNVMTIAADGGVTVRTFNASGKAATVSRLVNPVVPAAGDPPPMPALPASSPYDRTVTNTYDALGRLVQTALSNVVTWTATYTNGVLNTALPTASATPTATQVLRYDAAGNVVQETDGRGFSVYTYFDALGRKSLQIDQGGYVTSWTYGDLFDSATQVTKFATKLAVAYARQDDTTAPAAQRDPSQLLAALARSPDDRITDCVYDRQGRVKEQRVEGVAYDYVDTTGARLTGTTAAITDFTYDGLGNVRHKQVLVALKADGTQIWDATDFTYDTLGRQTTELDPSFVDSTGLSVRSGSSIVYDGLGNRHSESLTGNTSTGGDATTTYAYDANGNLVSQTDANNYLTTFDYDALGRVSRSTLHGDVDATGATRDVVKLFQYDAMGRQTVLSTLGTSDVRNTKYDVFGDVTDKGLGAGAFQEHAIYNVLGKVERSNSGDGAWKLYLYDINGNVTRQMSANVGTVDLSTMTLQAAAVNASVYSTFSVYDERNELINTVTPDISFQQDAASMAAAYTQTLTNLQGPISMGSTGQSASGGVTNTPYTPVSNGSGSSSIPFATPAISASNTLSGLTTPSSATTSAVSATQLAVDWSGMPSRAFLPYLAPITKFTLPGTGYSLGSNGQLNGGFPTTWQYRVLNASGGLLGGVVPGGSVTIPYDGSTLSLQACIPGGSWMTIGTITNVHYQGAGESENDFDCTLSVSRIVTASGRVEAFTNYGTTNQVALSVTPIAGTNSYIIGTAPYGSPNPNVVTVLASDDSGMTAAQTVTFGTTTGPSVAAPMAKADTWVAGAGSTTLELAAPLISHPPAGFVGPWAPGGIAYRLTGTTAWQGLAGPWTGSSEMIDGNSLAAGTYEYLIASGPSGERYGVFQVTASHAFVLGTLSNGSVSWTGAGMANTCAPAAFSSVVGFQLGGALASVNGASGTYTMTLTTADGTSVSQTLDGNLSTSFDMHAFAPFASTSRLSSATAGYHYVVKFNGSDGFQRFVGEGDGTLTLGGAVDQVSNATGSGWTPVTTLTLPGVASPSATITLDDGNGKKMTLTMSDPRIIRTVGSSSTSILVNFSDYLGSSRVQLTYIATDAQSSGTYSVSANGVVSCTTFSTLAQKPVLTLNIPSATGFSVFQAGQTDATLADARNLLGGSNGLFTWDASGLIGKGPSRFYYQAVTSQGVVVGQGYGSITVAADGTTTNYSFDTPQVKSAILTLTPALAAASVVLSVRPHGSGAAWQAVQTFTNVAANTQLAYDASAWRSNAGDVALDYQFIGTTGGQKVLGGNGWFTVQPNGNIVNNVSNTDRLPIVLNGPQGEHVPYLKADLTIPGSPPAVVTQVLAGVWNDSLYCTTFSWDVSAYQPSDGNPRTYPITLTMVNDAAGTSNYVNGVGQTIKISGQLSLGSASTAQPVIQQWSQGLTIPAQVNRHQSFNAFGQVAAEWDDATAGNAAKAAQLFGGTVDSSLLQTTSVYNTLGALVQKIDPQTTVVGENGMRVRARPVTTYGYDLEGRADTVLDANNHLSRQNYVGGSDHVSQQWAADNGYKITKYDVLGHVRDVIDELGFETVQTRDKLGNLTQADQLNVTRTNLAAVTLSDYYHYDAEGHRIWHRNAANTIDETFYDNLGRVTSTVVDAAGTSPYVTRYDYAFVPQGQNPGIMGLGDDGHAPSIGGYQLKTTGVDGRTTFDNVNYFGTTTWHMDEGGHAFQYIYDYGGHLARQVGSTGQEIDYQYYGNGELKEAKDLSPTDLTLTRYGYDNAGNRIWEEYTGLDATHTGPATQYQSSQISYDELGRMIQVKDAEVTALYEYDAVGNRRTVDAVYQDLLSGVMQHDTFWYTYDATNRFTLTKGSYAGNRSDGSGHIVQGAQGVALTYDLRGQRATALDATDGVLQTYVYSTDGFLEDTQFGATKVLGARRLIDNLGRTTEYITYTTTGTTGTVISDTKSSYDVLGRMSQSTDKVASTTSTYYYFSDTTDSAVSTTGHGALARVDQGPTSGTVATTTSYTYAYWDDAKETQITVSSTGQNVRTGTSRLYYDDDGFLSSAYDLSTGHTMTYVNSSNGLVLRRTQTGGDTGTTPVVHEYFYATGRMIGDVSTRHTDNASRVSYAEELAQSAPGGKVDPNSYGKIAPSTSGNSNARSAADFDENYQPINSTYPAAVAVNYTVRGGDTLRSIAQAMWGDGQMWYLIAQANNLSGSETLVAGQLLVIPNKVTNIHNNSTTFRPYNPGEVIGHIDPSLPAPPPPAQNKGCGTIGMIIMVVVAIVVTIYTAGAAAELLGAAMTTAAGTAGAAAVGGAALAGGGSLVAAAGTGFVLGSATATAVAAAAIGGAVGSIASQAVGDLMGNTKGFSWKQVATSAVGSAITAGVGAAFAPGATAVGEEAAKETALNGSVSVATRAEQAGMAVAQAVTSSAVSQLVKGEWSWRQIAASAVGSAAGQAAGGVMGDVLGDSSPYTQIANRTVAGMASGWASAQVMSADGRSPKPHLSSLFANSLGEALGDAASDEIQAQARARLQEGIDESDAIQRRMFGELPSTVMQQGIDQSDAILQAKFDQANFERHGIEQSDAIQQSQLADSSQNSLFDPNTGMLRSPSQVYGQPLAGQYMEVGARIQPKFTDEQVAGGNSSVFNLRAGAIPLFALSGDLISNPDFAKHVVDDLNQNHENSIYFTALSSPTTFEYKVSDVEQYSALALSKAQSRLDLADGVEQYVKAASSGDTFATPDNMVYRAVATGDLHEIQEQSSLASVIRNYLTDGSTTGASVPAYKFTTALVDAAVIPFNEYGLNISDGLAKRGTFEDILHSPLAQNLPIISGVSGLFEGVPSAKKMFEDAKQALSEIKNMPGLDLGDPLVRGVLQKALTAAFKSEDKIQDLAEKFIPRRIRGAADSVLNRVKNWGGYGEYVFGTVLGWSGLYTQDSIGAIQNPSGHGVDIFGKRATGLHSGAWDVFEIKTSADGNAGTLSARQANGADWFARDVLSKATTLAPYWKTTSLDARTYAADIQRDMLGKKFEGFVVRQSYINDPKQANVQVLPWNAPVTTGRKH